MADFRILVVEDDADAAEMTSQVLRDEGYTVDVAVTVDAAYGALARNAPLLVVLDLSLDRDSSGLHETLSRTGVAVLLLSSADRDKLRAVAVARSWDYLTKPAQPKDVLDKVRRILSRSQPPRLTPTPTPVPGALVPSLPKNVTPPDGLPLAQTRPLTWPESVHRTVSDLTRRGLRFSVSLMMFKLQLAGKLSPEAAIAMTACALGVESAIVAWKEKRLPVAVGLTALPFLLAGIGELAQQAALMNAAGYTSAFIVPLAGYLTRART